MNKVTSWPNLITFARIFLGPVLVFVYYLPINNAHLLAAGIFLLVGVTDWLDGFVARTLGQTSKLGAFLDPLADKIIVAIALVMLVAQPNYHLLAVPAMIIVVREIIVSGLREWMAEIGKRASVAVSYVGKCKTTVQMAAIILLLICTNETSGWLLVTGYIFLYVSAFLTLWSMVMYLRAAWPELESQ